MEKPKIIVALDRFKGARISLGSATTLTEQLKGSESFWGCKAHTLIDARGMHALSGRLKVPIFADCKLLDTPDTVVERARTLAAGGAKLISVHAICGVQTLQRAINTVQEFDAEVVAITVLTSMNDQDCMAEYGRKVENEVHRRAEIAFRAGAFGVVCAGQETALIQREFPDLKCLVPGIRFHKSSKDNHKRFTLPKNAKGADFIIVGREVTEANGRPPALLARIGRALEVETLHSK